MGKMNQQKKKEMSVYYQKTFRELRDNPPKNFLWKVFLSGVEETAFNIVAMLFIMIISLCISHIITIKILSIILYGLCIAVGVSVGGLDKLLKIRNMREEFIAYKPGYHDKMLGIYFHLARYYNLFKVKDYLNEYNEFLKDKEYYEGK